MNTRRRRRHAAIVPASHEGRQAITEGRHGGGSGVAGRHRVQVTTRWKQHGRPQRQRTSDILQLRHDALGAAGAVLVEKVHHLRPAKPGPEHVLHVWPAGNDGIRTLKRCRLSHHTTPKRPRPQAWCEDTAQSGVPRVARIRTRSPVGNTVCSRSCTHRCTRRTNPSASTTRSSPYTNRGCTVAASASRAHGTGCVSTPTPTLLARQSNAGTEGRALTVVGVVGELREVVVQRGNAWNLHLQVRNSVAQVDTSCS